MYPAMATHAWIYVTVLLILNAGSHGKPLENEDISADYVLVSCSNPNLIQQLSQAAIPFKCTGASKVKQSSYSAPPEMTYTIVSDDESLEDSSPDEVAVVVEIAESKQAGGNSPQPTRSIVCPEENQIYLTEMGICVVDKNYKPGPKKPSNNKKKTRIPDSLTKFIEETDNPKKGPTDCEEGFDFMHEIGICVKKQPRFTRSVRNELDQRESRAIRENYFEMNIPFFGDVLCKSDHAFVSELGICLPMIYEHSEALQHNPISIDFGDHNRCPLGTVYNSEIDSCQHFTSPVKTKHPEIKFFTKDEANSHVVKESYKMAACPDHMTYVSELHLCATFQEPSYEYLETMKKAVELKKKKEEKKKQTTTEDPFRLVLSPLTADQIGVRKCGENTVYISEIDICVPYEGGL